MAGVKEYSIQGYVNLDVCIELGTLKTREELHDIWDFIIKIFDDDSVPEGIVARRIK